MAVISVIVPVYNVENYLKKCLDSILIQTFKNIEIICVNDGSTDSSRQILEEYKNKDSRIIIVDKENGGLSSARNAGMKIAQGEFLSFIDADDWIEPDMLENLYNNITSLNTDISICAVHLYNEENQEINDNEKYFNLEYFDRSFDNNVFSFEDTKAFTMNVPVMAWNKLYRRSLIDKYNAEFPEGLIFEDGPFFFSIYFKTKKVSIVRDKLYYYRINRPNSILKKGGENFFNIIDVVNLMYSYIKDESIFEDIKYDFFKQKADDIIYRYELISVKLQKKFSKKFKRESCLLDEKVFDFAYINKTMPITYKKVCDLMNKTSVFRFYYKKFTVKLMYKIMQILCTDEKKYFFKFWNFKFRLNRYPKLFDIQYKEDRIYVVLLQKLKFRFKFEYSKLEQK